MEWKWTREIVVRVFHYLQSLGYDVERLVPEDEDISLGERCRRANKYPAADTILISIHGNAAGCGTKWMEGKGWEVWTSVGKTKADRLATCIYEEMQAQFPDSKFRKDTTDGDVDKESDFFILKHTACPAVLTENFFYDNKKECQFMLQNETKDGIAKATAYGIIKYIKTL